eukprot:4529053-Amphidinium_carterae.1
MIVLRCPNEKLGKDRLEYEQRVRDEGAKSSSKAASMTAVTKRSWYWYVDRVVLVVCPQEARLGGWRRHARRARGGQLTEVVNNWPDKKGRSAFPAGRGT